jgi:hypothetical protein
LPKQSPGVIHGIASAQKTFLAMTFPSFIERILPILFDAFKCLKTGIDDEQAFETAIT